MKNIACPLCGEPAAIHYVDSHSPIDGDIPDRVKDFSHANVCPGLAKATAKEDLLRFYVQREKLDVIRTDMFSYQDYEEFFRSYGFGIKIKPFFKVSASQSILVPSAYLYVMGYTTFYLLTEGLSNEMAFNLLRHRLLCGDVISLHKGGKEKYNYQLSPLGNTLRLVMV